MPRCLYLNTSVTPDLELSSLSAPQVDFKQRVRPWFFWKGSNWALWEREAGSSHLPWQINGGSHHRAGGQRLAQPANRIPMSLLTLHRRGCWRLAWGRTVGQAQFKMPPRSPCCLFLYRTHACVCMCVHTTVHVKETSCHKFIIWRCKAVCETS